jgi:hypothetical protein
MRKTKLTKQSAAKAELSGRSQSNSCDSSGITTTAGHGAVTVKPPSPEQECVDLMMKLNAAKHPDKEDAARMTELIIATPSLWVLVEKLGGDGGFLIERFSNLGMRAMATAKLGVLRKQFRYEDANPIERLLLDQILTTWLRLYYVEALYAQGNLTIEQSLWREQCLSNAQRRHLAAIEMLARVRRLARGAPLFQVNFAEAGSQQVNTQQTAEL